MKKIDPNMDISSYLVAKYTPAPLSNQLKLTDSQQASQPALPGVPAIPAAPTWEPKSRKNKRQIEDPIQ